ncbi:hypothetical protein SCHPADRAFT_683564 [Schizopora paradoxa]|uniref:Uncharacterized protein n=1 Tax=Schizopora paradoxa TaxID=27342 RepID=A0A0H2R485_9AGAM|nr:hypothetical protein SCHPADRAFT_683564 [Schizopora paradoxa]
MMIADSATADPSCRANFTGNNTKRCRLNFLNMQASMTNTRSAFSIRGHTRIFNSCGRMCRGRSRFSTRSSSQQPTGNQPTDSGAQSEPVDPRPSWLFTSSALLRVAVVPAGIIYAVFFHEFDQKDHVFMPVRDPL